MALFTTLRLAPTTRAALWIVLSGICAVMMNVLIRVAAQAMHPFEVAFFRCLFGLVIVLPWVIKSGPTLLRSRNAGFYLLRAAVGLVSMATWFYGITVVPLATATAVNFTAPLFATIAAVLVLHEDVRLRRWSAVVIGFVGVLVNHAAGERTARREHPHPAVVGGKRGDEQHYREVSRAHRAARQNRRDVHDLPDALVAGSGPVRMAMARPVDARRAVRARLPRDDRPFLGGASSRGGRCQCLRAFRVRPSPVRGVDRVLVVRRGHRRLVMAGRR